MNRSSSSSSGPPVAKHLKSSVRDHQVKEIDEEGLSSDSDTSSSSDTSSNSSTSSSSSSASENRKRKLKSKTQKTLIHSKINVVPANPSVSSKPIGPIKPPVTDSGDVFGPALPPKFPHLPNTTRSMSIIGPIIPSHLKSIINKIETQSQLLQSTESSENSDSEMHGPMPNIPGKLNPKQIELEERALEIKIAGIEKNLQDPIEQKEREEWMLDLPEIGLKTGLAALSNMKRTFHQGKEKPDFKDRSMWTKTPNNASTSSSSSKSVSDSKTKDLKEKAQEMYDKKRDKEQERIAKKYKKQNKHSESLLKAHQKKKLKEKKKMKKEMLAKGGKIERRPFSREVDFKIDKIDKCLTKQIVSKSKDLNNKFSTGQSKFL